MDTPVTPASFLLPRAFVHFFVCSLQGALQKVPPCTVPLSPGRSEKLRMSHGLQVDKWLPVL